MGSGRNFPVAPGEEQSDSLNSGHIFYISNSKNVTTSIHCTQKTLTKSLGGVMAPPGYTTGLHLFPILMDLVTSGSRVGGGGGNRPHQRTVDYNSHAKRRRSRIIKYFIFQYSGSVKNIGFICRTPIPHKRT